MRYFGIDGLSNLSSKLIAERTAETVGTLPIFKTATVIVGRDVRSASAELEKQLLRGLLSVGANVYVAGVVTPAALSLAAKKLDASAAIMLTGGEMSAEYCGIRIFGRGGKYLSPDETDAINEALRSIGSAERNGTAAFPSAYSACSVSASGFKSLFEEAAADISTDCRYSLATASVNSDAANLAVGKSAERRVNIYGGAEFQYKKFVLSGFPRFDGIRVRLDLSNGCLCGVAPEIFESLGAVVSAVENSVRDGNSVNINSNAASAAAFAKRVRHDEIGFAFGADGCRVLAVVDGKLYDGDAILLAISTLYRLRGKLSKRFIVGTKYSNSRLERELAWHGTAFIRAEEGAANIAETMRKQNSVLGGDKSGNVLICDKTAVCDGMITALTLLEAKKIMGSLPKFSPYPMREFSVGSNNNSIDIEKLIGTKGRLLIDGNNKTCKQLSVECFSKNYAEIFNSIQNCING